MLDAVAPVAILEGRLGGVVRDRLERARGPLDAAAVDEPLPAGVGPPQHPRVGTGGDRREVAQDRFADRVRGERPRQRLAEDHQVLELLGARPGEPRLGGRGGRFGLHLAAPGVLVKHEHHRQDEERRAQRHAVGVFDVAGGVEDIEQRTLEHDHQSEDKAGKQERILPADRTHAHRGVEAGDVPTCRARRLNDLPVL